MCSSLMVCTVDQWTHCHTIAGPMPYLQVPFSFASWIWVCVSEGSVVQWFDACVMERRAYDGGSVVVWGGRAFTGRTPLVSSMEI